MSLSRRVDRVKIAILALATLASGQEAVQPTNPQQPAADEPYVIEGGGVSLQPWHSLTGSRPQLRAGTGSTTTESGDLNMPGKMYSVSGLLFSMPAGKQNTLRILYFRGGASGETIAQNDLALFSVGYNAGDYLTTTYKLQNVRLSWDYLSYTFANKLRLKTFWEAQVTSINTTIDAPLRAVTVDSSGNVTSNTGAGDKWLALPMFGLGVSHAPLRRFRWEVKGSGFAIPGHGATWDTEASACWRIRSMELVAGHHAFFMKTSSRDELYVRQMLSGAYVGLRWYWGTNPEDAPVYVHADRCPSAA